MFIGNRKKEYKLFKKLLWKLFCNFFNKNKLKIMHCLCRPSRIMSVRINLLDETDFIHEIKDDLPGQALLDVVFARLNLIETSYFGIRYIDEENQTHWLDPASRISRQLKPKADPYDLYFGVKFYAADPCKLVEEITRYQLFLQVKQDVLQGRLPVAFELAAELAELGDYDQRRHSKGYVSEFRLLPNQSSELETRVAELHQQLKGMSPAAAELNYLDKVKWHDMYGVDLHPVLGEDSVEYFLGLTPSGIVVLRNKTTVAHYYWPRIAKVYYKGRYFMLRISDKNNELSTYGFETPRKSACKHLWRCCVEHHAFFRLMRVPPTLPNSPTNTSDIFQLGSRLKCSKEKSSKDSLFINRSPPAFVRVPSKRQPRRIMDDFLNGCKKSEQFGGSSAFLNAKNASNYESPYRSTYSIPTSLGINPYHQQSQHTMPHSQSNYNNSNGVGGSHIQTPDSPRSTRSAPWPRSQQRSLFGNKPSSPRSVRSASTTGGGGANGVDGRGGSSNHHHHHSQHNTHSRSSQRDHVTSANGTTNSQQQQRYRSSSVESHSSNDSRSTRRHKHRHRRTSDNESELSRGSGRSARSHHRKHRRSRHRRDSAGSEHESTRGRSYSGHRSSTARSASAVGSHSELIDSSSQWREAQRRQQEASLGQSSVQQASVSKSNTAGMTEDQLREIPYTVVETNSKRSNSNIRIHKSNSKNSVGGKSTGSGNTLTNGSGSISGHGKNRVDRIRGLCYQNSNPNDSNGAKNGSIRSASTVSSRECDRNSGLVRMMSSMSMGDFISPTGSNLSPMENSALRVSHEHTDSGLGADQDYAYSSERSSDSTRYGTNKSSGASSGSHRKSSITHSNIMNGVGGGGSNGGGVGNTSAYNSLMQQTPMQQQQHHQQQPQQSAQTQQQQQQLLDKGADKSKPSHRLLNYTTFENNQYKFSLNNVFGTKSGNATHARPLAAGGGSNGSTINISNNHSNSAIGGGIGIGSMSGSGSGSFTNNQMDHFPEWPNTPAAPYYYQGPSTVAMQAKKRDAKSDLGFPTRRLSGQCITKTQLLTGGGHLAPLSGMGYSMSGSQYPGYGSRLHPAKSDLFLAYPTTNEYEPPFIYNYKMPQMPEFLRSTQQQAQQQQQQQQQPTAYHISGSQTADPSLPPNVYKTTNNSTPAAYGGATPATDVMYYQFDNTACSSKASQPIVQQPKSLYNAKTTSQTGPTTTASPSHNMGPLVFLQHQQNVNGSTPTNANISSNVATTSNNSMQQTSSNISNNTIGNDRHTPTTTITTTTTTNTSSSQSRSTTCKIDEEPSHNLDNEDDEDLYDGEVSYDEYDDGCLISHVNNNEQLSLTKDTNVIEASRTSSLASPTIRHLSSLAHHINLDNSNVNNNNNQQQQEPEHVRQHQQQQNLLSPNANTNLKSITNSLTPSNNSNPSTISNHSLHTNKPVITTQPTSPTLVKTSNCNNTCSNSGSSHNMQQNSHHNHLQQQQQLNHNNSSLQQIENLPPNTNTNSNFNLNSTHTSAPYTNSPLTYTSFNINNTSITNTQTQANIAATAATALQQSSSTTTTISCTAIATTATTTLSSSPLHSTTRSIQNQLQNQNQNISSSLEIILSPIIQSSRRRAQS
ncbi:Band 4.1-like protein 4 [Lucilia cuprina]|nr:Band 4.1-like protein 4 [Lucilia cuprina]